MKRETKLYLLGGIALLIGVCLLFFNQKSPSVEEIDHTMSHQHQIDQTLSETLKNTTYTFESPYVSLNPYGNAPLSALIAFHTDEAQPVTLTVKGKDEQTTFTHTFDATTSHLIPVYGLYADTLNQVTLTLGEEKTQTIELQTDPLPADFPLPTHTSADRQQLGNDLYFLTPASTGYTAAYDINGDVRWFITTKNIWEVSRLNNGHLLLSADRTSAPPYYMTGLVEMDLIGKIYVDYQLPGGYHHDAIELPNGNFLVATNTPHALTVEDAIVEVDRQTGEIIKTWDLTKILPMEAAKSENWTKEDWFHNNSVAYDEANRAIVLSGRHQDAVVYLDYDTGELKWIVGDPTGWPDDMQSYFFTPIGDDFEWQWSQHSAKILANGDLALFDNGNNRSKDPFTYLPAPNNYSRGVVYHLNPQDMTIEQTFQFGKERGSEFYSPYISEIDELETDHYLVHSGGIGSVNGVATNQPAFFYDHPTLSSQTVEVKNGETIFELTLPAHFYRASKMSLYPPHLSYSLTPGEIRGTLGETPTLPIKVKHLNQANALTDDTYAIKLSKEPDRLIFTGDFHEGQKVKLILNKLGEQKVYDIRVSSKAYSAMCVDLFDKEQIKDNDRLSVTKYINAAGLSGTYELYLEIDGTLYTLHQSVTF